MQQFRWENPLYRMMELNYVEPIWNVSVQKGEFIFLQISDRSSKKFTP